MGLSDQNANQTESATPKPRLHLREQRSTEKDTFLCTCGPCKRFWKTTFTSTDILEQPVLYRAQNTSTLFQREQSDWRIKVGDQVIVHGKNKGMVKYVGLLDENLIAPEVYVGVQLHDNIGSTHNGIYNGKRYFHCPRGHGAMVPYCDVRPLNPPEAQPPLRGNSMFPSYSEVLRQRSVRRLQSEETEAGARTAVSASGKILTVYDNKDIAYQDAVKMSGHKSTNPNANTATSSHVKVLGKPKVDPIARRYMKWREDFGGGDRGERLVKTLRKLHESYEKGTETKFEESTADSKHDETLIDLQLQQPSLVSQQPSLQQQQQQLVLPKAPLVQHPKPK